MSEAATIHDRTTGAESSEMTPEDPVPYVTQGQFFEAHQQLLDRMDEQHRRLRESVEGAVARIGDRFLSVSADWHATDTRVTAIEVARQTEEKQAIRVTALLSTLTAAGVVGLKTLVQALLKR